MGYRSRAKATADERAEVLRLREAGRSLRVIAAEVFGDARYRGRVERILERGDSALEGASGSDGLPVNELAPMEAIRVLYERRLAMLVAGEVAPSMTELQKLLEVQRRLDAYAQYERLRDLTHEV